MKCSLSNAELNQYLDGALSPSACERVEQHLFQCPTCSQTYDALFQLVQDLRGLQSLQARDDSAERVLEAIDRGKVVPLQTPDIIPLRSPARIRQVAPWLVAACLVVGLSMFAMNLYKDAQVQSQLDTVVASAPERNSLEDFSENKKTTLAKNDVEIDILSKRVPPRESLMDLNNEPVSDPDEVAGVSQGEKREDNKSRTKPGAQGEGLHFPETPDAVTNDDIEPPSLSRIDNRHEELGRITDGIASSPDTSDEMELESVESSTYDATSFQKENMWVCKVQADQSQAVRKQLLNVLTRSNLQREQEQRQRDRSNFADRQDNHRGQGVEDASASMAVFAIVQELSGVKGVEVSSTQQAYKYMSEADYKRMSKNDATLSFGDSRPSDLTGRLGGRDENKPEDRLDGASDEDGEVASAEDVEADDQPDPAAKSIKQNKSRNPKKEEGKPAATQNLTGNTDPVEEENQDADDDEIDTTETSESDLDESGLDEDVEADEDKGEAAPSEVARGEKAIPSDTDDEHFKPEGNTPSERGHLDQALLESGWEILEDHETWMRLRIGTRIITILFTEE